MHFITSHQISLMRLFTFNITDKEFADLKHVRSIFSSSDFHQSFKSAVLSIQTSENDLKPP